MRGHESEFDGNVFSNEKLEKPFFANLEKGKKLDWL